MNLAKPVDLNINYITKKLLSDTLNSQDSSISVANPRSGAIYAYAVPKSKKTPLAVLSALKQYSSSSKDIYDQMSLCYKLYKYESILSIAIDIMEEFAVTKLFIDGLDGPGKVLIDFWTQYVNLENKNTSYSLNSLLRRMVNSLLVYGNVFPYVIWRKFKVGDTFYQLPMDVVLLNPLDILIPKDNISLTDKKIFFKIDKRIVSALKKDERFRTDAEKELVKTLPAQFKKSILKNKGSVELDFKFVSHIKRKAQDYEAWGIPYLLKTLPVLNRLKSLEDLDQDTLDGILGRIVLIKVGNPDKPDQREVDYMKAAVSNPAQGMFLVTGPHVELDTISSDNALINLADRYDEIKTHLFDTLGIPMNLFSGRYNSQGNRDAISVLSLQQREEELREQLLLWVKKIINQILLVNNFDNITPNISWSILKLHDPDTLRQYVTDFYDRGMLSINTAQRQAGYDFDTEKKMRQLEHDSGDDAVFMVRPMPSTIKGSELLDLLMGTNTAPDNVNKPSDMIDTKNTKAIDKQNKSGNNKKSADVKK